MLKSCFFGDIRPDLAEDILLKLNTHMNISSYLVRQCDRDPSVLILSFTLVNGELKHIIIPDFGSEGFSRRLIKDRLEDTTCEVEKLLASHNCQNPVIPDIPVTPVPQWKKRSSELTGGPGRCSICPAFGDPKKIVRHPQNHHVKLCENCDIYVMYKTFAYHSKKCTFDREKLLSCPHDKCDYSSFHKGHLVKHERAVHSKLFACELEECDKKFSTKQQFEKHMEKHEKSKKKEKTKRKYVNNSKHVCKICGEMFGSSSSKYRHVDKVHGKIHSSHAVYLKTESNDDGSRDSDYFMGEDTESDLTSQICIKTEREEFVEEPGNEEDEEDPLNIKDGLMDLCDFQEDSNAD